MHQVVLLWNRMGARDDTDAISRLNEISEKTDPRTGGITDDQTCGEVNDIDAVTDHFLRGVLNVTPPGIRRRLYIPPGLSLYPGKG